MSLKVTFADKGTLRALQKQVADLPKRAQVAAQAALLNESKLTMDEAQRTVPVVTGHLRSSAFVNVLKSKIDIGYSAPHAVYVHEVPYSGKTTRGKPGAMRNGQGYKWLARAAQKIFPGSAKRIAQAIAKAMRKGAK